jgi:hypothetical protein
MNGLTIFAEQGPSDKDKNGLILKIGVTTLKELTQFLMDKIR